MVKGFDLRISGALLRATAVALLALALLFVASPAAFAALDATAIQQDDGAIDDLDDVEGAVIQIEAVGSFVDPGEGLQSNVPGYGSGFIISPDGIAVTNNHVVTGGALFRVYVSGKSRPVNARVLGASECADLAVIDLQGGGYPYLSWYDGSVRAGLDVYSAGFPLGDPEFALTRGIVSKAAADGETNWASIDSAIMHDATINPGNSGGPLITADGQVVAVNYASNSQTNQYFAIPGDLAQEIIAELSGGVDLYSLGINGEAFDDGEGLQGIWVYSVKSGSPADLAGILPGDFITELEGIPLGSNGLMTDYCDILASHAPTDVMAVKVLRVDTDEVLSGQINGRALTPSVSIADTVTADTPSAAAATSGTADVFVPLMDEAGILYLEVPERWSDTSETDWTIDGDVVGTKLTAAPDLDSFYESWGEPGVVFSFSDNLQNVFEPLELLDTLDYSEVCDYVGRTELDGDGYFLGGYDEYENCGGGDTVALVAVLTPQTADYLIGLEVYAVSDADIEALDHVIDTFWVEIGGGQNVADWEAEVTNLVDVSDLEHEYTFYNGPYFSALVPAHWQDIVTEDWVSSDDEVIGKITRIAGDVQEHQDSWLEPGVQIYLMTDIVSDFDPEEALDLSGFEDSCDFDERIFIEHEILGVSYSGGYDVFVDCGGADVILYTAAFVSDARDHAMFIDFVAADAADDEAWEVLLESFFYGASVQPLANSERFANVTDSTGRISVSVPVEWVDVEEGPWVEDGETVGVEMTIAADVDEYYESWEVSGMYLGFWEDFGSADTGEILDILGLDDQCTFDSRYDIEDERMVGQYDLWTDCGGVDGSTMAVFAVFPASAPETLVIMRLYMATQAELSVLDTVLNTVTLLDDGQSSVEAVEEPVEEPASSGSEEVLVNIVTATLNVRSGPGTNYERIATVDQGFVMLAVGQWNNCAWLLIEDVDGAQGWVSGDPAYTQLDGSCASIPAVEAPPAPATSAAPTTGSTATTPSGQGCVNWKNQVGIEVNITLTRASDNWNTTFQVPNGQTRNHCVDPGKYTYTASAPNGGSINGDLTYEAGVTINFDLNP